MSEPIATILPPTTVNTTATPIAAPAGESFTAAMERHAAALSETPADATPEAPAATETATTEAQPEAPKRKVVEAKTGREAKLEQLRALAQELDLVVEDKGVTVTERHKFREAAREKERRLQAAETEMQQRIQARISEVEADIGRKLTAAEKRLAKADAIERAHESGDPDGHAQALGYKDWNELQENYIRRFADPNYKELRELKKQQEEFTKERERIAAEAKQRAEQEAQQQAALQRQQAQRQWISQQSELMKASTDSVVRAFHDDTSVLSAIYAIQEAAHLAGHQVPTPDQALKMPTIGGDVPIIDQLRAISKRYKVFYDHADDAQQEAMAEDVAEALGDTQPKKMPQKLTKKPTSPTPPRATVESSPERKWKDDREFFKHARNRLAEAIENDRKKSA